MFLKALHVLGFKSFADKTHIEFHPGITAIVGPNGCGKSNVLDAIRWVLGEQSAKALRGGQMQDVIFSGSDARKPLSMAEVSLTFGDCEAELGIDYHEVTITRRLFRDGTSEYELNKAPCRLRDIHQLFMDTGIGRTAYSIMEQGKIDQILSARPEDRRAVFEEAAGITKFKAQKKEALRKLENTDSNLTRLDDIIREVSRQLLSLQRQAAKAKRYQDLFAELRELELRLSRHHYDQLINDISQLATQVEQGRFTHDRLSLAVEAEDQALAALRNELTQHEQHLAHLRDELNLARRQAERAEQREANNQARIAEFTELADAARLEITGTDEKIRIQVEQHAALENQLRDFAANVAAAKAAHEEQDRLVRSLTYQVREADNQRSAKQHEISRAESALSALRNQLTGLEMQQKNTALRIESLRTEQTTLQQRRDALETERTTHQATVAEAENRLTATKETLAHLRQQLAAQQQESRRLDQAHRDAQNAHQKLAARIDALAQLETSHADSPPATQHLLAAIARGQLSARISGTLSDHLTITPGHEAAIALLLGDAVNAIVVHDQVSADTILSQLRDKKDGQVVLAPLPLASAPTSAPEAAPEPLAETAALRFVNVAPPLLPHLNALLDDAHVVSDLTTAWQLKLARPRALIATASGALITRDGLLYSSRQQAGASAAVFTRRNERQALAQQLDTLQVELTQAAAAAQAAAETIAQAQHQLAAAQAEVQQAEIAAATLRHSHKTLTDQLRDLDTTAARTVQELNRLLAQEESDRTRAAQAAEQLQAKANSSDQLRADLTALEQNLALLQGKLGAQQQTLVEHQIHLATLQGQQTNWQQQLNTAAGRLQELRDLIAKRQRDAADYENKVTAAHNEIALAQTEKQVANQTAAALDQQLQEAQAARTALQTKIRTHEDSLRNERKKLLDLQAAHNEAEVRLAQRRMAIEHLTQHIQAAYNINIAEQEFAFVQAESGIESNVDWTTIELQVKDKREKLDAMGPVNLESIAEYEELQQRETFLQTQHADLTKAKAQLLQAIAEINATTETMFAETFEQVKKNFQLIFSELFGGGKATLTLTEPDNPLECGIDIVARPPGKQPQSITLLSGGEKTMTAVALLFSIYMVKPSPFCVLDEMDAPLDESNINRFIKMVKRFTEHSQFVIITHNKRTISMADALFGVTQEERGCSKVMSLQLTKDASHPVPLPPERTPSAGDSQLQLIS